MPLLQGITLSFIAFIFTSLTACASPADRPLSTESDRTQAQPLNIQPANKKSRLDLNKLNHIELTNKSDIKNEYKVIKTYHMGDADSRISARQQALTLAKVEASEMFGTQVSHELELINGNITKDRIQTYSNAYMQTRVLDEKHFIENNNQLFTLEVLATVDKTKLLQNIEEIANSDSLATLEAENAALKKKLEQLNKMADKKDNSIEQSYKLALKRQQLIQNIDKNLGQYKRNIDQGKLTNSLANNRSKLDIHKSIIQDDSLKILKDFLEINIGEPYILEQGNRKSKVAVDYSFEISPEHLTNLFSDYFERVEFQSNKNGNYVSFRYRNDFAEIDRLIGDLLGEVDYILDLDIGYANPVKTEILKCRSDACKLTYHSKRTAKFKINNDNLKYLKNVKANIKKDRF